MNTAGNIATMSKRKNPELTVKEIAQSLGISTRSVLNYIKTKELKAIKVGKSWYIKRPSFDAFVKRYDFTIIRSPQTMGHISSEKNIRTPSYPLEKLRLYQICLEAFKMSNWQKLKKDSLSSRLAELRLDTLQYLGAGFYAYNAKEKRYLYAYARQKVGAIVALLYSTEQLKRQWQEELEFIETELLSALSALIRKMETYDEKQ